MSGVLGQDCILCADFVARTGLVLDLEGGTGYFKFNRTVRVPLVDSFNNCDEVLEMTCPSESKAADPCSHLDP